MDDLRKRLRERKASWIGAGMDPDELCQEAAARIIALERQIAAADKLAERFRFALLELNHCTEELFGEDYNCPEHNAALIEYRATKEKSDGC